MTSVKEIKRLISIKTDGFVPSELRSNGKITEAHVQSAPNTSDRPAARPTNTAKTGRGEAR
jgi:hypothetical protein